MFQQLARQQAGVAALAAAGFGGVGAPAFAFVVHGVLEVVGLGDVVRVLGGGAFGHFGPPVGGRRKRGPGSSPGRRKRV